MARSPFSGVKTSAERAKLNQSSSSITSTLPLDKILPRPEDTRPLNQAHVDQLAESIAVLGLIQPIAVDIKGRLLAGGHRLAAIKLLKKVDEKSYNKHFSKGIPIRNYEFDASQDEAQALAIEATENEKRRDYTPAEVRELADKLEAAGYHRSKGRAKQGQKSVGPTLSMIVGKSQRTIERYLASNEGNHSNLKPTNDGFRKQVEAALRSLQKLQTAQTKSAQQKKLLKDIEAMIERLEQELSKES